MQYLRLKGTVGQEVLGLQLDTGLYHAGSLADNDLVLPASGVSRRHARFEVDGTRAVVHDLDSKNGTFVNGRRILEAVLRPGDEIELGETRLYVEAVEPEDAELGLVLGEVVAEQDVWTPPRETTEIDSRRGPGSHGGFLPFLEAFVMRLSAAPRADVGGALGEAVRRFGLQGAWLVEQGESAELVVAAGGGASGGAEAALGAASCRFEELREASSPSRFRESGDPPVAGILLNDETRPRPGLVVAGSHDALDEADVFLPTLLRWCRHFRSGRRSAPLGSEDPTSSSLVFPDGYLPGASAAMRALYSQMALLARGELPILIIGETGVGKECLARIVHASSARSGGPFLALNCAAIPAELLEAELFGVERGAATGVRPRPGKFRQARGGTLFLDEIGDMSCELQAKLLRALQEKEVQPVGGAAVRIDVRIVSATNVDIREKTATGAFRSDLYYRIAGSTLAVPALRDRQEDVPGLVEHLLHAATAETGRSIRGVTVKALRALSNYSWPGNVRELEHEIRRLAYLCPAGQAIDSGLLSPELLEASHGEATRSGSPALSGPFPNGSASPTIPEATFNLEEIEMEVIRQALAASQGTQVQAARLLGISRDALRRRIDRYGIDTDR